LISPAGSAKKSGLSPLFGRIGCGWFCFMGTTIDFAGKCVEVCKPNAVSLKFVWNRKRYKEKTGQLPKHL
jgi:hypothetical protein